MCIGKNMPNYTHLTARELEYKWLELIGCPIPPIGRSLIIKYLVWYKQAKRDKVCVQYVRRILNLSFLSPKIVRSILNGTQPADCTLKKLLSIRILDWMKQNKLFFDEFF